MKTLLWIIEVKGASMNDSKRCGYPKCRSKQDEVSGVTYYGVFLCDKHWGVIAEMGREQAHSKLGITIPSVKNSET